MNSLLLALLLVSPPAETSRDWHVDNGEDVKCELADGSSERPFCSVQDALDAASDGDRILIAKGTYRESLSSTKDLELIGLAGYARTILEAGQPQETTLSLSGGKRTTLRELTIQGGGLTGISVRSSGATLLVERCLVQDNTNDADGARGGGIAATNASVTIRDSTIRGNSLDPRPTAVFPIGFGAGVYVQGGSLLIERSLIEDNHNLGREEILGGGLYVAGVTSAVVRDSRITGNSANPPLPGQGGGIYAGGVDLLIERSVIAANEAYAGGGLYTDAPASLSEVELTDNVSFTNSLGSAVYARFGRIQMHGCTVVGSTSERLVHLQNGAVLQASNSLYWRFSGAAAPIGGSFASLAGSEVSHSNVLFGWTGTGTDNLDTAPTFVDASAGDYRLAPTSPLIDAGDPGFTSAGTDVAGNGRLLDGDLDRSARVDIGAHEFSHLELTVGGLATPGGVLDFDLEGTGSLLGGILAFSTSPTPGVLLPRFGPLFFDPALPFGTRAFGPLPATFSATIPPSLPLGTDLVFQAIGFDGGASGMRAGNLSNAVAATLR